MKRWTTIIFLWNHSSKTFVFLTVLGPCCCMDFLYSCREQGLFPRCKAPASRCGVSSCVEHGLQGSQAAAAFTGSKAQARLPRHTGPCSARIAPDQALSPRLPHWLAESLPPSPPESPKRWTMERTIKFKLKNQSEASKIR